MKISAIIQTRTGSTRLPGKALKKICGKTIIEHIIERILTIKADSYISAIPEREDKSFVSLLQQAGTQVVKGSEDHVLSRFHDAISQYPADIIIRVNGDNLLIHPAFVAQAVDLLIKSRADYLNVVDAPVGCGVDVFTSQALDKAFSLNNLTAVEKEHVIPVFFRDNLFQRKSLTVTGKLARKELRLTLDTQQDFDLMNKIYENLYHPPEIVSLEKAIDFLDTCPDILSLNKDIQQKGWK